MRRHDANLANAGSVGAFRGLEIRDEGRTRSRRRRIPANTLVASAICGTHFGLTKDETSMTGAPASDSLSMKAILSAVEIDAASFWSPSRGPTSTTETRDG
jgi:hypothetical protein